MTNTITPLEFLKNEMESAFADKGFAMAFEIDRQCLIVKEEPVDDEGWPPYSKSIVMPDSTVLGFLYPVSPAAADIVNTVFETKYLHPSGVGMGFALAYNEYTKKCLCGGDYVPDFDDATWDYLKLMAESLGITPAQIIERSTLRTVKQFKESGALDDKPSELETSALFEKRVRAEFGDDVLFWQKREDGVDYLVVGLPEFKEIAEIYGGIIKEYGSSADAVWYKINETVNKRGVALLEGTVFMRHAQGDGSWFENPGTHEDHIGELKRALYNEDRASELK
tara:strand:- start:68 stop:910 length:843 start_codon:yes stop_codon:yes gene_type:complete